ncbi:hypothetical protein [Methanolobus psychrotolerans]|uniref:hypothetical protein n=1 Tax=Methanolobus psychrotolerans TaxID=1874706 RepID=UPI0013ED2F3B|nr:hypothetical protein [Methanolobus psychrotolerans]
MPIYIFHIINIFESNFLCMLYNESNYRRKYVNGIVPGIEERGIIVSMLESGQSVIDKYQVNAVGQVQ